ncbi:glyceraldehyde 3-phosphate dehydrogenase NAD-binding domain-containing protein [Thalassospira alkalitolerans]|uniref:glyceraldehyde 3-phosphate dehydrogenase NAD-binding domain-containing protein n=1 Tax=Thalassospira alkalitolerans TaxID=1293890 RepID=UPI003AA8F1E2
MLKIAINGFGRIGRMVARQINDRDDMEIVLINDLMENLQNLVYLYNYDSNYGRSPEKAVIGGDNLISFGKGEVVVTRSQDIMDIEIADKSVDVVIDASGVASNAKNGRKLVDSGLTRFTVVTHAPGEGMDKHVILGVNDQSLDPAIHKCVSSSICDANAIAHPIKLLEDEYGIEHGFVTTLHPWLSYQNLVDGPVNSQSQPAHYWEDFSLGRSSVNAIIPKGTTAIKAIAHILPDIPEKIQGFSYRIPTGVVCTADLTLTLKQQVTAEEINELLERQFANSEYVALNRESRISVDYEMDQHSVTLDLQWTAVSGGNTVKLVCWYDNEWGYAARVVDLAYRLSA